MPGQITLNTVVSVWTEFVKAIMPVADQINAATNGGFSEGYQPQGAILSNGRSTLGRQARLRVECHPDQDPATNALIREALEEFHTAHPKGMELMGKLMRGEISDGPGVAGAAEWRRQFAGASYNAGDGQGAFTVTAPE